MISKIIYSKIYNSNQIQLKKINNFTVMKKIIILLIGLSFSFNPNLIAQSSSQDKYIINDGGADYLADYIIGLYKKGRFDGIKILDMNNETYMISAGTVTMSDYKKTSSMRRVAEIRAKRNIINFINEGSQLSTEMFDLYEEGEKNGRSNYETYFQEITTDKASGFVSAMQTLATFKHEKDFIYIIFKKIK